VDRFSIINNHVKGRTTKIFTLSQIIVALEIIKNDPPLCTMFICIKPNPCHSKQQIYLCCLECRVGTVYSPLNKKALLCVFEPFRNNPRQLSPSGLQAVYCRLCVTTDPALEIDVTFVQ
jgi:hypothetical protein